MHVTLSARDRGALEGIAKQYRCGVRELVVVAVQELIKAHKPQIKQSRRRAPSPPPAARQPPIASSTTPASPSSAPPAAAVADAGSDVVWNGASGRRGVSLTGNWNSRPKAETAAHIARQA